MKKNYLMLVIVVALLITIVISRLLLQNKSPVQKGVEWLIKQQDKTDPKDHKSGYRLIYKVTTDNKTAEELSGIIKKTNTLKTMTVINEDVKYGDWTAIEETAKSLQLDQCAGRNVTAEVTKLKKIFLSQKNEIRSAISKEPASVINILYFLGKLGITDEELLNETMKSIRAGDHNSIDNIYGLTHIIFTNSDFLDRYLNPADFQKEIGLFENILSKYASTKKINSVEADELSEVIISLKLLNRGNDPRDRDLIKLISKKLIEGQNMDGSWGESNERYDTKIHHTVVAVLALMDYLLSPRQGSEFCQPTFSFTGLDDTGG